ncbi:CDP-alcohol phosphatidyltransferase family protein [Capnocytophaga canimorsus]|uniref:CDP-alcohol phosphatidyltransferase family protein n=1 Tax=Capnocytophaga canimorsus TaxID=28188 RepID=UPI00385A3FB5
MKKHVPNCITLLNLLCGCIAVIFAVKNQLQWAGLFVALGIFFDFFDGFFARLLHVKSDLGLQLDSLADMVTSGLTPGIVMFQLLSYSHFVEENTSLTTTLLPYFGLIITLASAYRLANFNIDSRQTTGFIGLPTPANTLFILSLPLILLYQNSTFFQYLLNNTWVLLGICVLSAYLLNANIRLFSLKFSDYSFKNNKITYLFLIFCVLSVFFLKFIALALIILVYVLLSLFTQKPKR